MPNSIEQRLKELFTPEVMQKFYITGGYHKDGTILIGIGDEPIEVMSDEPLKAMVSAGFTVWPEKLWKEYLEERTKRFLDE